MNEGSSASVRGWIGRGSSQVAGYKLFNFRYHIDKELRHPLLSCVGSHQREMISLDREITHVIS